MIKLKIRKLLLNYYYYFLILVKNHDLYFKNGDKGREMGRRFDKVE